VSDYRSIFNSFSSLAGSQGGISALDQFGSLSNAGFYHAPTVQVATPPPQQTQQVQPAQQQQKKKNKSIWDQFGEGIMNAIPGFGAYNQAKNQIDEAVQKSGAQDKLQQNKYYNTASQLVEAPQAIGMGLVRSVEEIPNTALKVGYGMAEPLADPNSWVSKAFSFTPAGRAFTDARRQLDETLQKTGASDKLKAAGKPSNVGESLQQEADFMKNKSQEYTNTLDQSRFSREKSKSQVGFDIGQGFGSLIQNLAMAYATGGETALPSLSTGLQQYGQDYTEARQRGTNVDRSSATAAIDGIVQSALEKVGLDKYLGEGGNALRRFATRALDEGAQEAAQQLAQNIIQNKGYKPEQGIWDNVAYSGLIGGVVGGAAGVTLPSHAFSQVEQEAVKQGVPPAQAQEFVKLLAAPSVTTPRLPAPQGNQQLTAPQAIPGTTPEGSNVGGDTITVPNSPGYDKISQRLNMIDQKLAQFKQGEPTSMSATQAAKLQRERNALSTQIKEQPNPSDLVPLETKPMGLKRIPSEVQSLETSPENKSAMGAIAQDYAGALEDFRKSTGGVQVIGNTRQSSNPDWYQQFYKETGKAPTKADMLDIAHERLLTGEAARDGLIDPKQAEQYQQMYEQARPAQDISYDIEQVFSRNADLPTVLVDNQTGMSFMNKHWVQKFDQNLKLVEKNGTGFAGTFGLDPNERSKALITLVRHAGGKVDMVAAMHELAHGVRALAMTDAQRLEGDKLIGERFKNANLAKQMTPVYQYFDMSRAQQSSMREGLTRLSELYKDVAPPANDIPSRSIQTLYRLYENASPSVRQTIETTGGKELAQLLRESQRQIKTGDFSPMVAEELFVQAGAEYYAGQYKPGARGVVAKLKIWFDNLVNNLKKGIGLDYDKLKEMWANVYSNKMEAQIAGNKYTQGDKAFLREDGKPTELMVTHNLTSDNLLNALRIGGIPQASLAISNPQNFGMDGYGEITLVGNNALVDPKARGTKTYASDVYSPRQPRSQQLADDASIAKIKERLAPAMDKLGEKYVNLSPGDDIEGVLSGSDAAVATFLSERGMSPYYGESTSDTRAGLRNQLYEGKLYDDFYSWLKKLVIDSGAPSKIFGGWTNSGNKRLLDDTVDNALKVMRQEARQGGDTTPGLGNIRARITPQFKSIQDIINAKDKLTSTEKMNAVKQTLEAKIYGIQEKLDKYATNRDSNQFTEYDRQMDAIGDYMKGDTQWFESKFPDAPVSVKQELDKFRTELQNAPTEYFESVSDRAVQINEFEKALVPENVSPEVVNALKQQGLDVVTYKEGQRQQKLQELAQADNPIKASIAQEDQTPLEKLDEKIVQGKDLLPTRKERAKKILNDAEIQLVDKYSPIADLGKAYKKLTGEALSVEKDPYVAARLYAGVTGKINQQLEEFQQVLKNAPDIKALEQAGVLRRILTDRSGIDNPLTQQEALAAQDELKAKLGDKKWQQTQDAVDKVIKFHDSLLKALAENGIISKEAYASIKENNQNYFTKFDVIDHLLTNSDRIAAGNSFNVASQDVVKRQKGTTKSILSPVESTIRQAAKTIALIERNQVGQKVAALSTVKGLDMVRELGPDETVPGDMEKISTFENGQKKDYIVPKAIGEAFKRLNRQQADLMTRVARRQASLLRTGATSANLGFALISNPIRDIQSLAFNSKNMTVVSLPYWWLRGLTSAISQNESYQEFIRSGGGQSGQFAMEDVPHTVKRLEESKAARIGRTITNPKQLFGVLNAIEAVGNKIELAPRLGEFQAAQRKGKTSLEAAYDSRNVTVDFSKSGEVGMVLNQWVPFLNARAQGTINVISSVKDHPVKSAFTAAAIAILPAILSYLHNRKEYPEELDSIPGYVKDNNFIIIYGKNRDADGNLTQVVKIPKGEVGKIITNPIEGYMEHLYNNKPLDYAAIALDLGSNMSPIDFSTQGQFKPGRALGSVLPPGVKALVEALANYSFYNDQPLVQGKLAELPAREQSYSSTSDVAKFIGDKTGYSPIKIDNAIRDMTGGLFNQATPKGLKQGTVGRIIGAPGNQLKTEFYDKYNTLKAEQASASNKINEAISNGDTSKAQDIAAQHNKKVDQAFGSFNFDNAPDLQDQATGLKINLTDRSINQRKTNIENKTNTKDDKLSSATNVTPLPTQKRSRGRGGRVRKLKIARVRTSRPRAIRIPKSKVRRLS